jgi:hypothetical protein
MILTPATARPLQAIRGILTTLRDGASDPDVRREAKRAIVVVDDIASNPTTLTIDPIIRLKMDLFDCQGCARLHGYHNDADALDGIGILLERERAAASEPQRASRSELAAASEPQRASREPRENRRSERAAERAARKSENRLTTASRMVVFNCQGMTTTTTTASREPQSEPQRAKQQRVTIMMFEVTLLDRTGSTESARFFTRSNADDYLVLAKGNGKLRGGAIESDGSRLRDFGLLRDGTTVKDARKALKELNG